LPDLVNLFLLRWMHYCTDNSFETGDFLVEKRAHALLFRPNLPLRGFISTTILWHCLFNW
jgi:hypothetical protein